MNKTFRNKPGVKQHTTTNTAIVLGSEQHLLHHSCYPVKLDYVHNGKFVGETVLLHVYDTILNARVHAQTTFLLPIRERCSNTRHSPSKATIARLMLQSVRASWMLNCYFLSDSGVGILAFLCVVVKGTENLIYGAGKRPQKYGNIIDKTYGVIFFLYICSSVHRNSRFKKSNKMQQYADIYLLLNYSTCLGRPSRPSSGVGLHGTAVAASGTDHTIWGASLLKRDAFEEA